MPQFRLKHVLLALVVANIILVVFWRVRIAEQISEANSRQGNLLDNRVAELERINESLVSQMKKLRLLSELPLIAEGDCPSCGKGAKVTLSENSIGNRVVHGKDEVFVKILGGPKIAMYCDECDAWWTAAALAISVRPHPYENPYSAHSKGRK
jgi:hypothetical protein